MPGLKTIADTKATTSLNSLWENEISDHVNALVWSPDGGWLAAAAVSGPITIFETTSGLARYELPGHNFGTTKISWNSNGTLLASAGQDGKVRVWDTETGQERAALDGGAAWVEHLAWNKKGDLLLSAAGRKLRLWNEQGELVQEYPDHLSTISDILWHPTEEAVFVSAEYGNVHFWKADNSEAQRNLAWKGSILVLAWSGDGKRLATGDQDATVHYWIVETGQDLQMHGYPTKVRELAWDNSSRYLATGGGASITVWDCAGKGPEGSRPLQLKAHQDLVSVLTYQQSGSLLASGGQDGLVAIWQPGKLAKPLAENSFISGISQIAWSPNDQTFAVGTEDGVVVVFTAPMTYQSLGATFRRPSKKK